MANSTSRSVMLRVGTLFANMVRRIAAEEGLSVPAVTDTLAMEYETGIEQVEPNDTENQNDQE